MPHRLDNVARASFTLGADHRCTLTNTPQCLTQVACTTHKRHLESKLIDVMRLVRWGEHLALVDIIDPQSLENLRLGKMPDTHLGHHRDRHCLHDLFDL